MFFWYPVPNISVSEKQITPQKIVVPMPNSAFQQTFFLLTCHILSIKKYDLIL